ncbi:MAG: BadF/BadG/BcrA/BcrD ATPase family protein [Opitutaceae bacterium]|jgi:N-acetylglucosamine kinase-like BadF-type ATPase
MSIPLFCGIDAGGTSTRALVASPDGRVRGTGRGPGGNPNHYGWPQTGAAMLEAMTAACAEAGARVADLTGVFSGVASVITADDRAALLATALGWSLSSTCAIGIDHDIRIALEGGLSGRPGIALVAGTGSSCYGRNAAGKTWQAGGWDQLLDDLGSGYDLAQKGMVAASRDADGRGAPTRLKALFFEALAVGNVADFAAKIHRPKKERHEIAAFAPRVFEAAAQGDAVAHSILASGADALADMAAAVAARLFPDGKTEIIFSGGLLEHNEAYALRVATAIRERLPKARISPREASPVMGALALAAKTGGHDFIRIPS